MSRNAYRIIIAAALLLLCFCLVFFNVSGSVTRRSPAPKADASAPPKASDKSMALKADISTAPAGHEPGERLADFTLETIGGGTFTLSENAGKVTVINLWATWCGPCVKELPYFDALQKAHPDDVKVLAIHSDLITDDPEEYLSDFDYGIDFAIDRSGEVIQALGGSTMLPQTVIVGRDGVVTYNQVGSVTPEALEELVNTAAASGQN